jgi:hypothetical protein
MEDNKVAIKKKRWNLRKEKDARIQSLQDIPVTDPAYKPTLDSVKLLSEVRNSKVDTAIKVLQILGILAIGVFATYKGYQVDESDSILRNKCSLGISNKLLRF